MRNSLKQWFANAPILQKQLLSFAFALAVFLLNMLLLYGAVSLMSDVRAYVNGEGLWSKAEKDAVYSLRKYTVENNSVDYANYNNFLAVTLGDKAARLEMEKSNTDYNVAYQGLLEGRNSPEDIPGMIFLFKNFRQVSYLDAAINIWAEGDVLIAELQSLGDEVHAKVVAGNLSRVDELAYLTRIESLNYQLTLLEDNFSFTLGDASRFVVRLVLLVSIILTVAFTLFASFLIVYVSRFVARKLNDMQQFAERVAASDLSSRLTGGESTDEMGSLARSLNAMADNFQKIRTQLDQRNKELESRVRESQENNQFLEKTKLATLNLLEDLDTTKNSLEEEKLKDEAILSSIGDGMVVVDRNDIVTLTNQRAQDMLGFNSHEILGKRWADVINLVYEDNTPVPTDQRPIAQAIATGGRIAVLPLIAPSKLYYFVRKNGTKFPAEIVASPIFLNNQLIGVVQVFRDITREIEIEKVKTEFVSIASHQLRTPLSTINWYSEILLSGDAGALNDNQKDYLQEIYRGNQRMIDLVNALLNVSRLEVGAFIVEAKSINLPEVAKDVLNELKPQIAKKNIQVVEKYDENLPPVEADYSLSRIIFQNLLSNAIKYTPDNGKVGVEIKFDKDKETIKISDTGMGIPREQQDKIFTKLFRADNAREADPDGTGLGLYIIKSVVDQTSGRIWFESEENKGTSFFVEVPVHWMQSKSGARRLI